MPGTDEELGRDLEQKASQIGMHMMYRMGGRMRPPTNRLGIGERFKRALSAIGQGDSLAQTDAGALEAMSRHGLSGRVEGHVEGGVPYMTLAATDAEGAQAISRELSYFGIEHHTSVDEMCGRAHIVTDAEHNALGTVTASDIEARRSSGAYREERPAEAFEAAGRSPESSLYEIYVPDRQLQEKIAAEGEGALVDWAASLPDSDPKAFIDKVMSLEGGDYTMLTDLPAAQRDFIEYHDVGALRERLAALAACKEASGEVFWNAHDAPSARVLEQLGIDPADIAGEKFAIELKTVPWDPEGQILTDNLTELGIPFEVEASRLAQGNREGIARITISERHTGYAKQVIDDLTGHVRGFSAERVANYDELARAAREGVSPKRVLDDRTFRSLPLPLDAKHRITSALQELEVEYALAESPEDGTFTITMKESELRRHGYRLNRAADTLNEVRPPEFRMQAQHAYERSRSAQQNRSQMNRKVQNVRARERTEQQQRNAKVSRDVRAAKRSAEAQKTAARETMRRHSHGSRTALGK